jgi:predicted nucleic acid-binding protein
MFSKIRNEENSDIPKNILVLQLSDFNTNDRPERTRTYEESSVMVPVSFEYYETIGRKPKDNEIMSVRTKYIQCINKDIADYIFDGYMKEENERLQETIVEYLKYGNEEKAKEQENNISEVSKELWKVDRGYYLADSKSEIIIQKNNIIYILNSDVDFSQKDIVDICMDKLKVSEF